MADSDIVVSNLRAASGIGHIALTYETDDPHAAGGLGNLALNVVEVWAAESAWDDEADATLVAEGNATSALHMALDEGDVWYYRVRARNQAGFTGDFEPALGDDAVTSTVGFAASSVYSLVNGKLVASVASNALTIAVKTLAGNDPSALDPVSCAFPDPVATSGTIVIRQITSPLSMTIPDGASFISDNYPLRLWWMLADDGGTVRLCVQLCGLDNEIFPLPEGIATSSVAVSTLIGGASATRGVVYSETAFTNKQVRIAGYTEWLVDSLPSNSVASGGLWATAPDIVRPFGPGIKKPGEVVQVYRVASTTAAGAHTDVIPLDNTPPLSSEGRATAMVGTFTPRSAVNLLHAVCRLNLTRATNGQIIATMFRDFDAIPAVGDVDAIAVESVVGESLVTVILEIRQRALTLSAITFQPRYGTPDGANVFLNRNTANAALFGGYLVNQIVVTEYQV